MVRLAIDMMGSDLGPTGLIPGVKALLKDYDDVVYYKLSVNQTGCGTSSFWR